jgi:hypothetical protein
MSLFRPLPPLGTAPRSPCPPSHMIGGNCFTKWWPFTCVSYVHKEARVVPSKTIRAARLQENPDWIPGRICRYFATLYAPENLDRYDALAIVTVGILRAHAGGIQSETRWKEYIRNNVRLGLGVRPVLENARHAEREVAALFRAKDAVLELGRDGQEDFLEREL